MTSASSASGWAHPSPLATAALFFLLTLVCTWPMTWDARAHVQDAGDPLLEIAVLTWASQALTTPGDALLDAPQFYPYRHTALYQNSFFGQTLLFAPLWSATGNPVFAFQLTVLAALFLSAMCMWGFVRALTGESWAGILAGALFALHHYRFRNLQHLQVMSIWWWPLALWGLESFLLTRRRRAALLLLVSLSAQFACSIYMGLMLAGILAVRVLVEMVAVPETRTDRVLRRRGLLTVFATVACVAPLAIAYLGIVRQFPPAHDLGAITDFSAAPRDYLRLGLSSAPYHWLRARAPWQYTFDQFVLFPGAVPLLMTAYGFLATGRWARAGAADGPRVRRLMVALLIAAAGAVVLSLGPYLKLQGQATAVPLPALWLLRHLPGYTIFRVNTRFAFVLLFALCLGVGHAYRLLVQRHAVGTVGRITLGAVLLLALVIENWNAPVPSEPVPVGDAIPAAYHALAEDPAGGPILEVPLGRDFYEDIRRVYYGLSHGRRLVNGYSTVQPPGYAQWVALVEEGPTPAFFAALAAWNVRTVVVHYGDMTPGLAARWRTARNAHDVAVWRTFADAEIWSLTGSPPRADSLEITLRSSAAPAGRTVTVEFMCDTTAGSVWRSPYPLGLRDTIVTWQPSGPGAVVEQQTRALLPLFVVGARPERVPLSVRVPVQPGDYILRVDFGVATAEAPVVVTRTPDAQTP